jgi:excisionase family DNA binding protein
MASQYTGGRAQMVTEMPEIAGTRLLGFDAAASYLNVNLRTIRRLVARGVLQPVHVPTLRRVLFDRQDLDSLIEAGKTAGESSGEEVTHAG